MSDEFELIILFDGYSKPNETGLSANCTCTLLKSRAMNIIIDTRTPWDGEALTEALQAHKINPEGIDFCISTHGHSDHVGCNYLFKNALQIVGKNCISRKDNYYEYDFTNPYIIHDKISIITTPGHTSEDITVMAELDIGLVAIVGDLFENEKDLTNDVIWKSCSEFPDLQAKSREIILNLAEYIVPGHGPMFKNPKRIM